MESISAFFDRNIVIVFFFYGLAFFSMGLAVWLEVGKSSEDRSAKALLFLAAFGLLHGFHEWFEVYIILQWPELTNPSLIILIESFRVLLLAVSFLLLFIFGLRLLYSNRKDGGNGRRATVLWTLGFFLIWLIAVILVFAMQQPCGIDCLAASDVLSRYLLAIPAALLAAWAMKSQSKAYAVKGMPGCARDMTWAAVALVLYGVVGQLFTRQSFLFPSTVVNADLFRQYLGIPIQLFRGLMAAGAAIFVIRAMRSFELERRRGLEQANDARADAQRELLYHQLKTQKETEALNQELQEAVQDLTMLFELSRSLASTLDREVMLKQAMSKIYDSVPRIHGGMIMLRESADQPLQNLATVGFDSGDVLTNQVDMINFHASRVSEAVVASGESYCWTGTDLIRAKKCACTTGIPDPDQPSDNNGERTMGMPLVIQEHVAGSLVLSIDCDSGWLTPRDLFLIRTVAGQLSLAVANAKLYREVRTRDALRGELLHQVVSAQEHERQRIARDLHDGAGQMATALGLGLAASRESVRSDPEMAERQLIELKVMSGQLVQELQGLIAGLRPSILDDLGLVPALRGLVNEFEERTKVETHFEVGGAARRIDPDMETIIFRIGQEGMTNVTKHANATVVRVLIEFRENSVGLSVSDNGRGFAAKDILLSDPGHRWGLIGIRERVALVGGSCEISSKPSDGTTIKVVIPTVKEVIDG